MEYCQSLFLNESILIGLNVDRKPIYIYEWTKFFDKIIYTMDKSDIKLNQTKLYGQICQIIFTGVFNGKMINMAITNALANLFRICEDSFLVLDFFNKSMILLKATNEYPFNAQQELKSLNDLYNPFMAKLFTLNVLSKLITTVKISTTNLEELMGTCIKLSKNISSLLCQSPINKKLLEKDGSEKEAFLHAILQVFETIFLNSSDIKPQLYLDVYKFIVFKNNIFNNTDKEKGFYPSLQILSAQIILLSLNVPKVGCTIMNDFDLILNHCYKLFDYADYFVRKATSKLIAFLVFKTVFPDKDMIQENSVKWKPQTISSGFLTIFKPCLTKLTNINSKVENLTNFTLVPLFKVGGDAAISKYNNPLNYIQSTFTVYKTTLIGVSYALLEFMKLLLSKKPHLILPTASTNHKNVKNFLEDAEGVSYYVTYFYHLFDFVIQHFCLLDNNSSYIKTRAVVPTLYAFHQQIGLTIMRNVCKHLIQDLCDLNVCFNIVHSMLTKKLVGINKDICSCENFLGIIDTIVLMFQTLTLLIERIGPAILNTITTMNQTIENHIWIRGQRMPFSAIRKSAFDCQCQLFQALGPGSILLIDYLKYFWSVLKSQNLSNHATTGTLTTYVHAYARAMVHLCSLYKSTVELYPNQVYLTYDKVFNLFIALNVSFATKSIETENYSEVSWKIANCLVHLTYFKDLIKDMRKYWNMALTIEKKQGPLEPLVIINFNGALSHLHYVCLKYDKQCFVDNEKHFKELLGFVLKSFANIGEILMSNNFQHKCMIVKAKTLFFKILTFLRPSTLDNQYNILIRELIIEITQSPDSLIKLLISPNIAKCNGVESIDTDYIYIREISALLPITLISIPNNNCNTVIHDSCLPLVTYSYDQTHLKGPTYANENDQKINDDLGQTSLDFTNEKTSPLNLLANHWLTHVKEDNEFEKFLLEPWVYSTSHSISQRLLSAAIECFQHIYPYIIDKHKLQILKHFDLTLIKIGEQIEENKCNHLLKNVKDVFGYDPYFISRLNLIYSLYGCRASKYLASEEEYKLLVKFAKDSLFSSVSPFLRYSSARLIGQIVKMQRNAKDIFNTAFDGCKESTQPTQRSAFIIELACIIANGKASNLEVKTTINLLLTLSTDPVSMHIRYWSLTSLAIIVESCVYDDIKDLIQPMLINFSQRILNSTSDPTYETWAYACCISAITGCVGPELNNNLTHTSYLKSLLCTLCHVLNNNNHDFIRLEAFECMYYLFIYVKSSPLQLDDILSSCKHNYNSSYSLLRRKILILLKQIIFKDYSKISVWFRNASSDIEENNNNFIKYLLCNINQEEDMIVKTESKFIIYEMVTTITMIDNHLNDYITSFETILGSKQLDPLSKNQQMGESMSPTVDDDIDSKFSEITLGPTLLNNNVPFSIDTKLLSARCLVLIISTINNHYKYEGPHYTVNHKSGTTQNFLVQHLNELLRISFLCVTNIETCVTLSVLGLKILSLILESFENVYESIDTIDKNAFNIQKDRGDKFSSNHCILEQYEAQIGACLKPAFALSLKSSIPLDDKPTFDGNDKSTDVFAKKNALITAMACYVCGRWVSQCITNAYPIPQTIANNLKVLFDSLRNSEDVKFSKLEKISILHAYSLIYFSSARQTNPIKDYEIKISDLKYLYANWIDFLKHHSFEKIVSTNNGTETLLTKSLGGGGGGLHEQYNTMWASICRALSMYFIHQPVNFDESFLVLGTVIHALCNNALELRKSELFACFDSLNNLLLNMDFMTPIIINHPKILSEILQISYKLTLAFEDKNEVIFQVLVILQSFITSITKKSDYDIETSDFKNVIIGISIILQRIFKQKLNKLSQHDVYRLIIKAVDTLILLNNFKVENDVSPIFIISLNELYQLYRYTTIRSSINSLANMCISSIAKCIYLNFPASTHKTQVDPSHQEKYIVIVAALYNTIYQGGNESPDSSPLQTIIPFFHLTFSLCEMFHESQSLGECSTFFTRALIGIFDKYIKFINSTLTNAISEEFPNKTHLQTLNVILSFLTKLNETDFVPKEIFLYFIQTILPSCLKEMDAIFNHPLKAINDAYIHLIKDYFVYFISCLKRCSPAQSTTFLCLLSSFCFKIITKIDDDDADNNNRQIKTESIRKAIIEILTLFATQYNEIFKHILQNNEHMKVSFEKFILYSSSTAHHLTNGVASNTNSTHGNVPTITLKTDFSNFVSK